MNKLGVPERRSCILAGLSRSTYRYEPVDKDGDNELADKLHQIANKYNTAGYRTAWAYLRREGIVVNHKRVYRVWHEEGLSLPRQRKGTRKLNGSVPLQATHLNHVWTYGFVHDRTERGQPLRILTIEDEYTRQGLALQLDRSLPASQVIELLQRVFNERGAPEYIRSDNGPEFIANALIHWLEEHNVKIHHIKPGSAWQNAYGESFNATLRRECLYPLGYDVTGFVQHNWVSYAVCRWSCDCYSIPWGESRVVPYADHSTDQDRDVANMVQ